MSSRRSRCSDPSCSPSPAPSPTGTRAASPMSSSSPSPAAQRPRRGPPIARTRCRRRRPRTRAPGRVTARARVPGRPERARAAPQYRVDRAAGPALARGDRREPSRRRSPQGRGALVVVPDGRSAARVDAALTEVLGAGRHAPAHRRGSGPEKRYAPMARGTARRGAGGRRHPCRDVCRPRPRPRPRRNLGRRRCQPQRTTTPPTPTSARVLLPARRPRPLRLPARLHQLHRRGRPARRDRLGAAAARRTASGSAGPPPSSVRSATANSPGTRPRAPPGCPRWPGRPCGRASRPGPCSCRSPAGVTCRGCPANAAARPPAAGTARGPWKPRTSRI
ncbi:hypothetical protein STANM309S_02801 [Streptomyces tanashiensis]